MLLALLAPVAEVHAQAAIELEPLPFKWAAVRFNDISLNGEWIVFDTYGEAEDFMRSEALRALPPTNQMVGSVVNFGSWTESSFLRVAFNHKPPTQIVPLAEADYRQCVFNGDGSVSCSGPEKPCSYYETSTPGGPYDRAVRYVCIYNDPTSPDACAMEPANIIGGGGGGLLNVPRADCGRVTGSSQERRNGGTTFPTISVRQVPGGCPKGTSLNSVTGKCRVDKVLDCPPKTCATNHPIPAAQGNPIHLGTGNKYQVEVDYAGSGPFPLRFERTYHSAAAWQLGETPGGFARGWTHNYLRRINTYQSGAIRMAGVVQANGSVIWFRNAGAGWVTDPNVSDRLVEVTDSGGATLAWQVRDHVDSLEEFDESGRLIRITNRSGLVQTLTYDTVGRLIVVTDPSGRTLTLAYNGPNLRQVTFPDGRSASYRRDYFASYGGSYELGQVRYSNDTATTADDATRNYLYEAQYYAAELLSGIVDERGIRYATWGYDGSGRGILSFHGTGAPMNQEVDRTDLYYDSATQTRVKDALGQMRTYVHTGVYGERTVTGASLPCATCGNAAATTYDANGYKNLVTDFRGIVTDFDIDARGLETRRIDVANTTCPASMPNCLADKRTTETDWSAAFRVPTERRIRNAAGTIESITRYAYNARGQQAANCAIDPAVAAVQGYACGSQANAPVGVRQTVTSYCEQADVDALNSTCPLLGLVKAVDGPRTDVSDRTDYAYYAADDVSGCVSGGECHRKGDLQMVVNAIGQATTYLRYDAAGRPARIQDANGVITDLVYDERGDLRFRKVRGTNDSVETDDAITEFQYDKTRQVVKVIQPDGAFLAYTYDSAKRLTDVSDNLGNTLKYTLDRAGNRLQEDTRDGAAVVKRTLARVYDQLGQLQNLKNAAGTVTVTNAYDAQRNLDTATDVNGVVTDNDYDPLNRLMQTIQDKGAGRIEATTKYTYDARGNLRVVNDPKQLNTTYTYDGLNNLGQLTSPDTGVTNYTYDAAGNRRTQTDARNVTTTYAYDSLNRLVSVSYPTATLNTTYAYDQVDGTTGCTASFPKGRITRMVDASGTTTYCYDRFGNLTKKSQATNGTTFVTQYGYNLANRLVAMTYPSGLALAYTRDAVGRISKIDYKPASSSVYSPLVKSASYLPFGPVSSITYSDDKVQTRAYDQNYWIDSISSTGAGGLQLDFTEDALGNITGTATTVPGAPTEIYTYDNLYRLTGAKTAANANVESYTYDDTGNRLSKTVGGGASQVYGYPGASHRLTSVGSTARTYDANGNTVTRGDGNTIQYDDRNRMAKIVKGNKTLASYNYSGRGERVSKTVGSAVTSFVYDEAGRLIAEKNGTATVDYLWMDELPVGVVIAGTLYAVEPDHLGTPRVMRDPVANKAVWNVGFQGNAFGEKVPNEDVDGDRKKLANNLRFPGQYFDTENGITHNYFRDYESGIGRYVESDPAGLYGGSSTFSYANNRPTRFIDRRGLSAECYSLQIEKNISGNVKILSMQGDCPPQFMINSYLGDPSNAEGLVLNQECSAGKCSNQIDYSGEKQFDVEKTYTFWWKLLPKPSGTDDENEAKSKKMKRKCSVTVKMHGSARVSGWVGTCTDPVACL